MRLLILIAPVALSACASIVEGNKQTIAINSTPSGADCAISRAGQVIGRVSPTPGEITIQKTKQDIDVTCQKSGYEPVSFSSRSDFAAPFFGNILIGGPIGMGVDLASGAYNKYDAMINFDFESRTARAINSIPQENASRVSTPVVDMPAESSNREPSQQEHVSQRILSTERADRYQARREQLRMQK